MFTNSNVTAEYSNSFMHRVYAWMSYGLVVSGLVAYYVAHNPMIFFYVQQPGLLLGLIIAQLALVMGLTFFINRLSYTVAVLFFSVYALSLGFTFSSLFYIYTESSIFLTFMISGGMFGIMSVYGYVTQVDLTRMGSILFMALVGLIIAIFVNYFLASSRVDYAISAVGLLTFVLLTAYDTQKIKEYGRQLRYDEQSLGKVSLLGALMLYLDFINIFLFLLRFLGKRNEQ